jgi:cytochrome c
MNAVYASLLAVVSALSIGTAQADEALIKTKGCLACHMVDRKLVGPTYKDIAKRYAGQKDVEEKLAEKVIKGGKGAWAKELGAELPMPPNTKVKPDEATKLVKWILGQK